MIINFDKVLNTAQVDNLSYACSIDELSRIDLPFRSRLPVPDERAYQHKNLHFVERISSKIITDICICFDADDRLDSVPDYETVDEAYICSFFERNNLKYFKYSNSIQTEHGIFVEQEKDGSVIWIMLDRKWEFNQNIIDQILSDQ